MSNEETEIIILEHILCVNIKERLYKYKRKSGNAFLLVAASNNFILFSAPTKKRRHSKILGAQAVSDKICVFYTFRDHLLHFC